jgi:NTE family protein
MAAKTLMRMDSLGRILSGDREETPFRDGSSSRGSSGRRAPDRRCDNRLIVTPAEIASSGIGLVLSGGGGRGAYEVGVLAYIFDELAREMGRAPRVDILCGTSVGAINACLLAATLGEPDGMAKIERLWESLEFDRLIRFGPRQLASLFQKFFGGKRPGASSEPPSRLAGLLNTQALEELVARAVDWDGIDRNLAAGRLRALSVTTTDISTGMATVFLQTSGGEVPTWSAQSEVEALPTRIRPEHALASAALPALFPAYRLEGRFHCDGAVRQNTPMSPALRLGADRLLVVALRPAAGHRRAAAPAWNPSFAGFPYMLGKVLDALFLDHLDYDIERMEVFNNLISEGERVYGEKFLESMNAATEPVRHARYHKVRVCVIRPSEDLGKIAARHAREGRFGKTAATFASRYLRRTAMASFRNDAALLSYLLFDGEYATELMALGRRDAAARHDDLLAFFST